MREEEKKKRYREEDEELKKKDAKVEEGSSIKWCPWEREPTVFGRVWYCICMGSGNFVTGAGAWLKATLIQPTGGQLEWIVNADSVPTVLFLLFILVYICILYGIVSMDFL